MAADDIRELAVAHLDGEPAAVAAALIKTADRLDTMAAKIRHLQDLVARLEERVLR